MWKQSHAAARGNQSETQVALLDMPRQTCAPFEVSTLGSFIGQSSSVRTVLIQSDEELVRKLVSMLDNQLLGVLETRSVLEFTQARAEIWQKQKYVRARRALSDTMSNLASESKLEAVSKACMATLAADLQKQRGVRFGDELTEQAVFTMWTFARISAFAQKVQDAGEACDKDADLKLNAEYQLHLLWAQFHMDAVVAAMKFKKTIRDDVQHVICEGLRSAVNAYAILREALALRVSPVQGSSPAALPWDDEDERLLASSMRDMNADLSDDRR